MWLRPTAGGSSSRTGHRGIARLVNGSVSTPVLVEGAGSDWVVTIRGRRIPVTVRSWRERILADAETAAAAHTGPIEVKATLPGLIVGVAVSVGDEVAMGDAPPDGRGDEDAERGAGAAIRAGDRGIGPVAGETVATGAPLLRLE